MPATAPPPAPPAPAPPKPPAPAPARWWCRPLFPSRLHVALAVRWLAILIAVALMLSFAAPYFPRSEKLKAALQPTLDRLWGPGSHADVARSWLPDISLLAEAMGHGNASAAAGQGRKAKRRPPQPPSSAGGKAGHAGSVPLGAPVAAGDYRSIGRVRPYAGDINLPGEMKRMAEARSYKKEIVMLLGNAGSGGDFDEIYSRFAIAAIVNMKKVGKEDGRAKYA